MAAPGVYRAVFRVGDQAPVEPIVSRTGGGLFIVTNHFFPLRGNITFRILNQGVHDVDLSGAAYAVEIKRADGWHGVNPSAQGSSFQPGTIAAGKSYEWTWKSRDSTGNPKAWEEGEYRLVVSMPGKYPDRLSMIFFISDSRRN